jgi:hypothetical protein
MANRNSNLWQIVRVALSVAVIAGAEPALAQQGQSGAVVAKPPANIEFSIVYRTKMPRPTPETPIDPDVEMLMPSGEAEHENRRVEYLIVGDRSKMTIRQGGETSTRYYIGDFRIMKSSNGTTPYVTDIKHDYSHADDHFRDEFPFTAGFDSSHFKGTTTVDGKNALLYEREDIGNAAGSFSEGDDLTPTQGQVIGGQRLFVDATTRLPLRVEGEDFVVRFTYGSKVPESLQFPREYAEAVRRYILGSRVERAKPY